MIQLRSSVVPQVHQRAKMLLIRCTADRNRTTLKRCKVVGEVVQSFEQSRAIGTVVQCHVVLDVDCSTSIYLLTIFGVHISGVVRI